MTEQPAWVISSATAQRRSGNVRVAAMAAVAAMDWRRSIMGFDSCGLRVAAGHFLLARAALEQAAGPCEKPGDEEKGHRGHHDGAKAQPGSGPRRFDQALTLGLQVLGKFDDQNGVLGRQADD